MTKVPCGSCTLCCTHQRVFLLPGDDAAALGAVSDINEASKKRGLRLPQKPNGDCVHLTGTGCGVYDIRPKVCRGYDCRDHYFLPSAERRRREAMTGPQDRLINARGRALVEAERKGGDA